MSVTSGNLIQEFILFYSNLNSKFLSSYVLGRRIRQYFRLHFSKNFWSKINSRKKFVTYCTVLFKFNMKWHTVSAYNSSFLVVVIQWKKWAKDITYFAKIKLHLPQFHQSKHLAQKISIFMYCVTITFSITSKSVTTLLNIWVHSFFVLFLIFFCVWWFNYLLSRKSHISANSTKISKTYCIVVQFINI